MRVASNTEKLITDSAEKLTISDMVKLFNLVAMLIQNTGSDKWTPVKKFSSRAVAIKRLTAIAADTCDSMFDEVNKMLEELSAETATEQVADTAETATEQVADTAETATEQVAETATEQVAETAETATEQVADTATEQVADTATEQVAETATEQVAETAETATEQVADTATMGTDSTPADTAKTAETAVQETPFQRRHRIHLERLERLATEKADRKAKRDAARQEKQKKKEAEQAEKASKGYVRTTIDLSDNTLISLAPEFADLAFVTGRLIDGKKVNVSMVEAFYIDAMKNENYMTVKDLVKHTVDNFITRTGIEPDEKWAIRNIRLFIKKGKLVKIASAADDEYVERNATPAA